MNTKLLAERIAATLLPQRGRFEVARTLLITRWQDSPSESIADLAEKNADACWAKWVADEVAKVLDDAGEGRP